MAALLRAGLAVSPFPVDFQRSAGSRRGIIGFLPNAAALRDAQLMIREIYGRVFYRVMG